MRVDSTVNGGGCYLSPGSRSGTCECLRRWKRGQVGLDGAAGPGNSRKKTIAAKGASTEAERSSGSARQATVDAVNPESESG